MFERYTEKARRCIFFARYEASQFGSPTIDTEHLLLGILREDRSLSKRLFGGAIPPTGQPASPRAPEEVAEAERRVPSTMREMENAIARHEFEKARQFSGRERVEREELQRLREKCNLGPASAFDTDVVGTVRARIEASTPRGPKFPTSVDLPLSHPCKRALAYGAEESKRLNHLHIGTEHLLTGLAREGGCLAAEILRDYGITTERLREMIAHPAATLETTGPAGPWPTSSESFQGLHGMCSHPEATRLYRLASGAAAKMGSPYIETKHLLFGALEISCEIFFGASAAAVREQIKPEPRRREKVSTVIPQPTNEFLRAFSYAIEEAGLLGHKEVGSGHLALGLLREESCEAAEILHANGLSLDHVRRALAASSGSGGEPEGRNYV
jgi:ATP-dependent Clp protease ATP-binding subunit ClpA